ncbi:MAG: rhomboid family intramembrane serine protease [Bacteroidota bacterium]
MIPLKDNIPSSKFPIINWLLILVNAGIFIFQLSLDSNEVSDFIYRYGLIPGRTNIFGNFTGTFITNMFLHGGWIHFLSNMWILYIFGDNVEDRMGRFRYLAFYILAGFLASFTHFILYSDSDIPAIGASGAIAGVMAAYMFLFPGSRVLSLVPIFFFPLIIPIPALIYIGIWFIGQFFNGTYHLLLNSTATGIAFWAHIGGFIAGLLFYKTFLKNRERKNKKSKN